MLVSSNDKEFCGYVCSDALERQQKLLDEVVEFSKVNPEWALIMLGKFMDLVYETRMKLPEKRESKKLDLARKMDDMF